MTPGWKIGLHMHVTTHVHMPHRCEYTHMQNMYLCLYVGARYMLKK